MRLKFAILAVLVLLSGCLGREQATVTKYVCADGSVVLNPRECIIVEKPATVKVYVCPDGRTENSVEDCPTTSTVTSTLCEPCLQETCGKEVQDSISSTSTTSVKPSTTLETSTIEEVSEAENACISLGCDADTAYVGSKNSDKYHPCDCRYAKRINLENIVCFSSADDAAERGYTPSTGC
ncbi:MAG: hypothetical protein V1921_07405 [Candidatus Altiarchaeota archaeon]